ncbi:PilW family protein [Piscinibacter sp.]|jgi:type IV pilus assembly protein PilW|uniref:PilW family protein n=1 Tax=Piscinibacter sp. TaxID=1903157 RepID=UPI00355952F9
MQTFISRRPTASLRKQQGVTLIELMVGLLVGLLVTVVIAQVLLVAEGQKRSATGGTDAQVNGALALYTLQREIQMAGHGLSASPTALGCEIKARYDSAAAAVNWTLTPVVISDGASGAPDTIQVLTGQKQGYSVATLVTENHLQNAASFYVTNTLGVATGDLMVAVPVTPDATHWCSVFSVTGTDTTGGYNQILHTSGTGTPWNPAVGSGIFPTDGYAAKSYLLNLGRLVSSTYSVTGPSASNPNTLQSVVFNSSAIAGATSDLFPQIVSLQAFYGKDTNADGTVDTYDTTTPTTQAGWSQVLAIRVAVVARSGQYEKDEVTAAAPVWDLGTAGADITIAGTTACSSSQCLSIPVDTQVGADWKHYRYKIFDTVVPLRNMLWGS